MGTTQDLTVGAIIRFSGELCQVAELEFRNPGNWRAFFQAKMRNLKTGRVVEYRFRSGEAVDLVHVDYKSMQYLYASGDDIVCMDPNTFDQVPIPLTMFGESKKFLKEGITIDMGFENEMPLMVSLPPFVDLKVTYTEPGRKGDTATRVTKPATLENGATVNVPLFINQGEVIRIDTRTGEYSERAK